MCRSTRPEDGFVAPASEVAKMAESSDLSRAEMLLLLLPTTAVCGRWQ